MVQQSNCVSGCLRGEDNYVLYDIHIVGYFRIIMISYLNNVLFSEQHITCFRLE